MKIFKINLIQVIIILTEKYTKTLDFAVFLVYNTHICYYGSVGRAAHS